jgi:hypothetical protein
MAARPAVAHYRLSRAKSIKTRSMTCWACATIRPSRGS